MRESCASEGETLPGSEVDMAAVQRTLPVDKTMSSVLGFNNTLLKNSSTSESRSGWLSFVAYDFRLLLPVLRGSSALHAIDRVRVRPSSPR